MVSKLISKKSVLSTSVVCDWQVRAASDPDAKPSCHPTEDADLHIPSITVTAAGDHCRNNSQCCRSRQRGISTGNVSVTNMLLCHLLFTVNLD